MHFKMFTADVFPLPQKSADLVRALVLQMSSEASQETIREKKWRKKPPSPFQRQVPLARGFTFWWKVRVAAGGLSFQGKHIPFPWLSRC